MSTNIVDIANLMKKFSPNFFRDQNDEPHISVKINNVTRAIPIHSNEFHEFVQYTSYKAKKIMLTPRMIKEYAAICSYKAADSGIIKELPVRIAKDGDAIIYNLARADGKQVRITSDGWSVVPQKVVFRNCSSEATMPVRDGSIHQLEPLLNIKDKGQMLLVEVDTCCWIIPDISKPVLHFPGEQGSAKTTISKNLKWIIDPAPYGVIAMTHSRRNLELALNSSIVTALDNLSDISGDTSDFLCGVCTGQSVIRRRLYTDNSVKMAHYHGGLILNGINSVIQKPDLNDRSIIVELERIPDSERKSDAEIRDQLAAAKPGILGAIFTIISNALKAMQTEKVDFELKRLADFTRVGYFIAEAIEAGGGQKFLKAYDENNQILAREIIDTYPVVDPIIEYMKKTTHLHREIRMKEFYDDFLQYVDEHCKPYEKQLLPKAPNAMSRLLRSCIGSIEKQGVHIAFTHKNDGQHISVDILPTEEKITEPNNGTEPDKG